jgi:hypothetical protein
MGLQEELNTIRKQQGESFNEEQEVEESAMTQVAEQAGEALSAVESAFSAVVSTMIPTSEMVEAVVPESVSAPMIDLSLPATTCQK